MNQLKFSSFETNLEISSLFYFSTQKNVQPFKFLFFVLGELISICLTYFLNLQDFLWIDSIMFEGKIKSGKNQSY